MQRIKVIDELASRPLKEQNRMMREIANPAPRLIPRGDDEAGMRFRVTRSEHGLYARQNSCPSGIRLCIHSIFLPQRHDGMALSAGDALTKSSSGDRSLDLTENQIFRRFSAGHLSAVNG